MPLTAANLNASLSFALSKTNTGFGSTTEGVDTTASFTLANLNITNFNQVYPLQTTITGSGTSTLNLSTLTNLVGETFSFGHLLSIAVLPTAAPIKMTGSVANGLTWFLGSTLSAVTIPAGGCLFYSEPVGGPGATVTSSANTLAFQNTATQTCTLTLVILGGTT